MGRYQIHIALYVIGVLVLLSLISSCSFNNDRSEIEGLLDRADKYKSTSQDSVQFFLGEIEKEYKKSVGEDDGLLARFYTRRGISYYKLEDYHKAKGDLEKASELIVKNKFCHILHSLRFLLKTNAKLDTSKKLESLINDVYVDNISSDTSRLNLYYLHELGHVYYEIKLDSFMAYMLRAEKLVASYPNEHIIRRSIYDALFQAHYYMGKDLKYVEGYAKKTFVEAKKMDDPERIANAFFSLGIAYNNLHKYGQSLKCYQEAQSYYELVDDKLSKAFILNNIGTIFLKIEELDSAKVNFLKAQEVFESIPEEQLKNDPNKLNPYLNLGHIAEFTDNFDEALRYFNLAHDMAMAEGFTREVLKYQAHQAGCHTNLGNYEIAGRKFDSVLVAVRDKKYYNKLDHLYCDYGQFLIKTNNPKEGLSYLKKVLAMSNVSITSEITALRLLSEFYGEHGNTKLALQYLNSSTKLKQEYLKEGRVSRIEFEKNALNYANKKSEQNLKIEHLKLEKRDAQFRNLAIIIILLFFLIGIGIVAYFLRKRVKDKEMHQLVIEQKNNQLNQLNSEFEMSNRTLDKFAQIAAHDLRAPLSVIQHYSQKLANKNASKFDEEDKSYFDEIESVVVRMSNMMSELLRLGHLPGQLKGSKVSFALVLEDALQNLEMQIAAKNAIINLDETYPDVKANRILLSQLLQNIIGNSIKYSKPDVTCQIDISYLNPTKENENMAAFCIADNGVGIAPENIDKITQDSFRGGDQKMEGYGIGLATCVKILDAMEGELRIESKNNEGSQFYITIPLWTEVN